MRVSEWVIAIFFAWTTALAFGATHFGPYAGSHAVVNTGIVIAYLFLYRMRRYEWARTARDWVPQALMIVAYKEMGWFAPASHTNRLEHEWIVWDRLLLDDLHGRALIEYFGPILPSAGNVIRPRVCIASCDHGSSLRHEQPETGGHIADNLPARPASLLCAVPLLALGARRAPCSQARTCRRCTLCSAASIYGWSAATASIPAFFRARMYRAHLRPPSVSPI